jgi:uncharacterized coiled-coil protein SlyX
VRLPIGKLGIVMSSARYKRDIHDMRAASSGLMKLRPVTFRYKNDLQRIRQYGLIAEEVARIYPELVTHGPDGQVETVNYLTLSAMLLNELQKQTRENQRQAEQIRELSAQVGEQKVTTRGQAAQLRALRTAFEERLATLEQTMRAQNGNRNLAAAFNR